MRVRVAHARAGAGGECQGIEGGVRLFTGSRDSRPSYKVDGVVRRPKKAEWSPNSNSVLGGADDVERALDDDGIHLLIDGVAEFRHRGVQAFS